MASPIKVLIVDDSVVIRSILTKELGKDEHIEIVDTAAHGAIALRKLAKNKVDVIILDLDMPVMNGVQTMKELGHSFPNIPVIIFSAQSRSDARASMDAMEHGAQACIHKSTNLGGTENSANDCIKDEMIPLIKSLCGAPASGARLASQSIDTHAARLGHQAARPELLVIGASTGGPNAVNDVISSLPESFTLPVFIVQHMPAVFTKHFAERLHKGTHLNVVEAEEGMPVVAGSAYLAPGNFHMLLKRDLSGKMSIALNQEAQENSVRPAVDVTMRSVVEVMGKRALTVILTGMGMDGLAGCRKIHEVGGTILVQDQATSVVWGMPGFVAKERLAHAILPLDQIGPEIAFQCKLSAKPNSSGPAASDMHAKSTPSAIPKAESQTPGAPAPSRRIAGTKSEPIPEKEPPTMQENKDGSAEEQPVLLVDDSRAMRSMLKRMIKGLGLTSVEAENGRDALEKIDAIGRPRFALVDWNMPEMNGLEFVKAIRSRPDMKDLALVMVTSETEMERVAEALKAGADEYMMKPFSTEDLADKLRELGLLAA